MVVTEMIVFETSRTYERVLLILAFPARAILGSLWGTRRPATAGKEWRSMVPGSAFNGALATVFEKRLHPRTIEGPFPG
jgi:hypothetical protein